MNCLECQEWLQRRLDGDKEPAGLAAHLAGCVACREQHETAGRLAEILRARLVLPPPQLSTRIVAGVLRDFHQRQTLRRRVWIGVGLAASIMALVLTGYLVFGPDGSGPSPAPIAKGDDKDSGRPKQPPAKEKPKESPPLGPTLAEARQAVAGLTGRLADTTRDQAKLLLAAAGSLPPPMPPMQPPEQPFDPAAWRQTSQGVGDGVQTVARSTRQAFDYFLRELTPTRPGASDKD